MGIFTNTGVNIDVNNVHVKQYLEGTPNIDKYYKDRFVPFVETLYNTRWGETRKRYFREKIWKCISEGLSESMFDTQGNIDPYVNEIVRIKVHAFIDGWNDRNEFPQKD